MCTLTSIFSSAKGYFYISRAVLFSDISSSPIRLRPHTHTRTHADRGLDEWIHASIEEISIRVTALLKEDVPKYFPGLSKFTGL